LLTKLLIALLCTFNIATANTLPPALADIVDNNYVTLQDGQLTLHKKTRWLTICAGTTASALMIWYAAWALDTAIPDKIREISVRTAVLKTLSGSFSCILAAGALLYTAKLLPTVRRIVFSADGIFINQISSHYNIAWHDIENITVENLQSIRMDHHSIHLQQEGRRLIIKGEYGVQLFAINENNTWLPIQFNDLILLIEHYLKLYRQEVRIVAHA
jgi:hypothetical protein